MSQDASNVCRCGGPGEIVADIFEQDLLELQPGERLWKLYCFQDGEHPTNLRHRIYTKRKRDGQLGLLTFAVHNPRREGRTTQAAPPVRSALARVPNLSVADLDRLIAAMRSQAVSDACEEVDLSGFGDLNDQLAWLNDQIKG